VTPIVLPDGKTTIPAAAKNSMMKNKTGLKGRLNFFSNGKNARINS